MKHCNILSNTSCEHACGISQTLEPHKLMHMKFNMTTCRLHKNNTHTLRRHNTQTYNSCTSGTFQEISSSRFSKVLPNCEQTTTKLRPNYDHGSSKLRPNYDHVYDKTTTYTMANLITFTEVLFKTTTYIVQSTTKVRHKLRLA